MSIFEKCEKNRKDRKTKILRKEKTLRYKNLTLQKGVFSGQGCKKQRKHNKKYKFCKYRKSWACYLLTGQK